MFANRPHDQVHHQARLEWKVAVETGGVVLGDKIKIQLEIEAIKASA